MHFLESEIERRPRDACMFHVIPAPLADTVSYGQGTEQGPAALIAASQQLEAHDGTDVPLRAGIFTTETATSLDLIGQEVTQSLAMGAVPVLLGGEHTVTLGALRAMAAAGDPVGVVQIDAHADLRDTYEGSQLSHACVMRRAVEDLGMPLVQIGVRAISEPELTVRERFKVASFDAADLRSAPLPRDWLPEGFPPRVYLTIDVDGLDPSVIPGTGTPEPGGLGWWQTIDIINQITRACVVVGFDIVELAPIAGSHVSEFAAARLVYNTIGAIRRAKDAAP